MFFNQSKLENPRIYLNRYRSLRYWHRPIGGLCEVINEMKKTGLNSPTLLQKKYIEIYAGSLLGMGLEENLGSEFWIAAPENDPPDMVLMTMAKDKKERILFNAREVEITREVSDVDRLLSTILRKEKENLYQEDSAIVCFVETPGFSNLKELSLKLKGQLKRIQHVFIVFHGNILGGIANDPRELVSVIQLSPEYDGQTFNLKERIKKDMESIKQKLIYVKDGQVKYGLRDGETEYPKIGN